MASLKEEDQEMLAQIALRAMKKLAQWERIASGNSMWSRFGVFSPIVAAVILLSFRGNINDHMAIILIFLLFFIQGTAASVHARIDAVVELMKAGQNESLAFENHEANQDVPPCT